MTDKSYGAFTRLFQSSEEYQKSVKEQISQYFTDNTDFIRELIDEQSTKFLEAQIRIKAEAEIKHRHDLEVAEQERLSTYIASKDPWFEVIDYKGDLSDASNYRWNQAFIDRVAVENGWHGLGPKETFKRFLADRDYKGRLSIIQEERDKRMDDPEPWFEWTVKGISDEGYPVHMEWNPAFISHLRDQGFTGRNEDESVKLWLTRMIRFTPQSATNE